MSGLKRQHMKALLSLTLASPNYPLNTGGWFGEGVLGCVRGQGWINMEIATGTMICPCALLTAIFLPEFWLTIEKEIMNFKFRCCVSWTCKYSSSQTSQTRTTHLWEILKWSIGPFVAWFYRRAAPFFTERAAPEQHIDDVVTIDQMHFRTAPWDLISLPNRKTKEF